MRGPWGARNTCFTRVLVPRLWSVCVNIHLHSDGYFFICMSMKEIALLVTDPHCSLGSVFILVLSGLGRWRCLVFSFKLF